MAVDIPFSEPDAPDIEAGTINYARAVGSYGAEMSIMAINLGILIDFHARHMSPHVLRELISMRDRAKKNANPFNLT